ncbi:class I SAM-dependent methyltransferase, partial [Mycobacterium avium]|uniref:class I SAM-dependent methyltransferase n=1 Tax=Mycobacterium avium TaxID=1764 RepID=UPI000ACF5D10
WGTTIVRALERYDVHVAGLTLSRNQQAHVQRRLDNHPSPRSQRVLLQGWQQFDEQVDRSVSIGAFEHFGRDR